MQVLSMTMDLFVARTMTTKASLLFCKTIELTVTQVLGFIGIGSTLVC